MGVSVISHTKFKTKKGIVQNLWKFIHFSSIIQLSSIMAQDPNEDTEWNDVLRSKGIIPEKPKEVEVNEDDIIAMMDKAIEKKTLGKAMEDMNLDELDELEDEEEERILEEYRKARMAEIKNMQAKSNFGTVGEISGQDYVNEVNKAGEGIWVILHLYKQGIPLCALINQYMTNLSAKFPNVKFLKGISTTCIPNYPDRNLPTLFVYYEGDMKKQSAGPHCFRGMNMTSDEFEFILGKTGAIKTEIKSDPRPQVKDVMMSKLRNGANKDDSDTDNDDW